MINRIEEDEQPINIEEDAKKMNYKFTIHTNNIY